MLLKFRGNSYFPEKLSLLIDKSPTTKYLMKERDIHVDMHMLNAVFTSAFNKMFKDGACKVIGDEFSNVITLSHSHLDCYALFKISKWAYGNKNCINVWKEKMAGQMQHLIAVNELIAKYVTRKTDMNKSKELKMYAQEVRDYLREKIGV